MISKLSIQQLRLFEHHELQCHPRLNLIYGENGSGKTTLLEAISLLAMGRSFRSTRAKHYIMHDQESCTVQAVLSDGSSVGLTKTRIGNQLIKQNGIKLTSVAELARVLPIQIMNQDSFLLLTGPAQKRRQLLDWGVFHVEQQFLDYWKTAQSALKHRNAGLRNSLPDKELKSWEIILCEAARKMDECRQAYFLQFQQALYEELEQLLSLPIEIIYKKGWREDTLEESLERQRERDRFLMYTQSGPHRADIQINSEEKPAVTILSRGQQKLLSMAFYLAQGRCFQQKRKQPSIYLIDDLAAELDAINQKRLVDSLCRLNSQIFVTGTDSSALSVFENDDAALFHVKHPKDIA